MTKGIATRSKDGQEERQLAGWAESQGVDQDQEGG